MSVASGVETGNSVRLVPEATFLLATSIGGRATDSWFWLLDGNEQTASYLSSIFVAIRHDVKKVSLSDSIHDALPVSTSMTGLPCSSWRPLTAIRIVPSGVLMRKPGACSCRVAPARMCLASEDTTKIAFGNELRLDPASSVGAIN